MKKVIVLAGMNLGFWKLEVTAGIEILVQGLGPYGLLNQSDQPTQFGHLSHLDLPYQQSE
jgi:hypothetical protein